VKFTRGSLRLSDGRLAPRSAGAASVLVWNATPWGDAIRAANAIPLLFSSYVDSSLHIFVKKENSENDKVTTPSTRRR